MTTDYQCQSSIECVQIVDSAKEMKRRGEKNIQKMFENNKIPKKR